jgi:hypothetical protein
MQFDIWMLFVVIGISTCSPNTCYQIKYNLIFNVRYIFRYVLDNAYIYLRAAVAQSV